MVSALPAALAPAVDDRFEPAEQPAARHMLACYGERPEDRRVAQVRHALLELSNGRLDDLGYYLAVAQRDHREVLAWARNPAQAPRARG